MPPNELQHAARRRHEPHAEPEPHPPEWWAVELAEFEQLKGTNAKLAHVLFTLKRIEKHMSALDDKIATLTASSAAAVELLDTIKAALDTALATAGGTQAQLDAVQAVSDSLDSAVTRDTPAAV